ncbi:MAG: TIGR04282 family arsenosugar biosynthesis glycosyltransferase [Ferruginibacter sp.]|nr:TIGR04282 family arsenosugar biosynthesis glycosyltransferase [Ferruginibacter sp.]
MRRGLIIFIRNPVAGEVKTRLAKTLGDEKTLLVYQWLLTHTREITQPLTCDKFLYYSGEPGSDDEWASSHYFKRQQLPGALGEKMLSAFAELFDAGYDQLVIIGSDCLELETPLVESAFQALQEKDVVIGPSNDGGYYLLGMNSLISNLFVNKEWSTATVYADTMRDISEARLTVEVLPRLNDIDEEADLPASFINRLNC